MHRSGDAVLGEPNSSHSCKCSSGPATYSYRNGRDNVYSLGAFTYSVVRGYINSFLFYNGKIIVVQKMEL